MMTMERPVTEQKMRITCEENGKLIATIVPNGVSVWCMYHKRAELIPREKCIAAWEKGQSVQCSGDVQTNDLVSPPKGPA